MSFLFFQIFINFENIGNGETILEILWTFAKRSDRRAARNYRFELHRQWMIYGSRSADTVRLTIQFIVTEPRTTLKLASLFASRILAKILIGNTRKWIRVYIMYHRFTRIPPQNKFHAARKVDKVASEWNVIHHSQAMVHNYIIY